MNRRDLLKSASATAVTATAALSVPAIWSSAAADARNETLLLISENGPNNLDIHGVGTNRPGYEASWNCYDRLIAYGKKQESDGTLSFDRETFVPELAEEWTTGDMSVTFKLRKDATFHDGTPVTAKDVKWSFDRAVTVGGFPTTQMAAGSLEKPEQFVAVDDHTFRVDFVRKDALLMADLSVIVPCVMNSELVKKHATAADPWGMEYTKNTIAGGGAYKVDKWEPGTQVTYIRNETWKSGPKPKLQRVVWRTVPSAGSRRALIEKGDADISFDLPAKDFAELKQAGKVFVASHPVGNGMWCIELQVKTKPFDNKLVRQAVAYAIPYQKIMDAITFGQARPLFGADRNTAGAPVWPQASGYSTDMAKAKALMAQSGVSGPIETTISLDLSQGVIGEPTAVLIQESLAELGIKTTINKVPGANWRGEMAKKSMPLLVNFFSGWLDYPEYFFFWCYHGQNAVFNTMSYQDAGMDALIDAARKAAAAGDKPAYDKTVLGMIDRAFDEVPRIPLFQPYLDVAMGKNISGYTYWFHRQLDYRSLGKA